MVPFIYIFVLELLLAVTNFSKKNSLIISSIIKKISRPESIEMLATDLATKPAMKPEIISNRASNKASNRA